MATLSVTDEALDHLKALLAAEGEGFNVRLRTYNIGSG